LIRGGTTLPVIPSYLFGSYTEVKALTTEGHPGHALWCGIFIVGGPELCESRLATSGCTQPPAETLIVSAAMGIRILSGRVLSALFEEPNKVCTRPRRFCDVSPTDLSILSPSQLSKRCHQASVQTGKQRIVEPGYTDADHTVSPELNTAVGHRYFHEGPRNSLGISERAKGNRKLWNDGIFDSKICDCRERRTSSCAVLFSSGRG
jgi:hypothetical protein